MFQNIIKGIVRILLVLKLLLKEIQVHMKVEYKESQCSSPSFHYHPLMANHVSFPGLPNSVDYFEANH